LASVNNDTKFEIGDDVIAKDRGNRGVIEGFEDNGKAIVHFHNKETGRQETVALPLHLLERMPGPADARTHEKGPAIAGRVGGGGDATPLDDHRSGRVIVRAERGTPIPDDLFPRLSPNWREAALQATQQGPGGGREGVEHWLATVRARDLSNGTAKAADYATALVEARTCTNLGDRDAEADAPPAFDLGLIDTATFFGTEYPYRWLVEGVLLAGENCVLGGPSKSLKTCILIDLAISLASATPFLGRFPVPTPVRVALISGESGRRAIQANAKQVCLERSLPFERAAGVYWGFVLPQLSNADHLSILRQTIIDQKLEVVILDPLYLSLLAGSSGINPGDMFAMGPLLAQVGRVCEEAGAMAVLCHHTVKRRDNPYDPIELDELAFSGIGQWMRQWLLISRRERFQPDSGVHRLHFNYGGSSNHSALSKN